MSHRFKPGERFSKMAGAGFVGEPLPLCQIGPIEDNRETQACFLCEDDACIEWPNCYVLNGAGEPMGSIYHVSECQMVPLDQ